MRFPSYHAGDGDEGEDAELLREAEAAEMRSTPVRSSLDLQYFPIFYVNLIALH